MGSGSKIDWTDDTWSPVGGCTPVSPGCDRCYASAIAHRFDGTAVWPYGFDVTLWPGRMELPLRWRRPRLTFVCPTGDLFHHRVPDRFIAEVWAVMQRCPGHTFQVLTKRHARMHALLSSDEFWSAVEKLSRQKWSSAGAGAQHPPEFGRVHRGLPNVWLGVSAEDQKWADIRIPILMQTPAFVRWVSLEPLLGAVDASGYLTGPGALDWVVAGGESGSGARMMELDWARGVSAQCASVGVAFFFKQTGSALARELGCRGKGNDPAQWPEKFPRQYPSRVR